jgi:pimeloyl-ACP methyl ester carboxylesterase
MALIVTIAAALPDSTSAQGRDVILLYGWRGSTSNWDTAKAAYEARGNVVHVLRLPEDGTSAGDTAINADYVNQYIRLQDLTNVHLDGHSLGGWLALYVAQSNPVIASVVLRDTGTGCWFNIPADQCPNSELLYELKANPPTVPVLNLNHLTTQHPGVDCIKVFNLEHNAFLSNAAVNAAAVEWPDANPCTPATPTPSATATPVPTLTPSPTPTVTPTATPRPRPCSWWDRWQGYC